MDFGREGAEGFLRGWARRGVYSSASLLMHVFSKAERGHASGDLHDLHPAHTRYAGALHIRSRFEHQRAELVDGSMAALDQPFSMLPAGYGRVEFLRQGLRRTNGPVVV